jgi:TolB protein
MLIENAVRSAIAPDGRTVFFLRGQIGSATDYTLWFASPLDGTAQRYARGALTNAEATSGTLRFSPDGSRLLAWLAPNHAFDESSFWEIPVPDGEPRRVLPQLSARAIVPPAFSWLPDSRHIVTTRTGGQNSGTHLWLADTAGDRLLPLTTTPGNEGAPSVAPDGRTIAFTSEATDFDLFEIPIDGSMPRAFLDSTRNEFDPAASPVDTKYAYVTDRTGLLQIWLQNREGYLAQPLVTETDFDDSSSLAIGSLAFSPDGSRLAFQRASGPSGGSVLGRRIWITPVTGGKPFPLPSDDTSYQDAPAWSPNGEWIAYLSGRGSGLFRLVKAVVGRGDPVTLLENIPAFVTRPQWSPDGNWIVCETVDGLTIVPADRGEPRLIAEPGWFAYAWDRDGRRLIGLRTSDDQHHIMLVTLDVRTQEQRVINGNLGPIPQAPQPIRGFSRLPNGNFLTSIASVKSDIYLIENLQLPRPWWARLSRY